MASQFSTVYRIKPSDGIDIVFMHTLASTSHDLVMFKI